MLQCSATYLDYSYRPGFMSNKAFKTSATDVFVCWRATEHSLELWQSPLPGISFTCAPFAVLMAACSRGETVSDSVLGCCSWLVGSCKNIWVCLSQMRRPVQFSKWWHFSCRVDEILGSRSPWMYCRSLRYLELIRGEGRAQAEECDPAEQLS